MRGIIEIIIAGVVIFKFIEYEPNLSHDGSIALGAAIIIMAIAYKVCLMSLKASREKAAIDSRFQYLVATYGSEDEARMIMAGNVWKGMSSAQLTDCLGTPIAIDHQTKTKSIKETWKYGMTGINRYKSKITLENGIVTAWTIKN